MDRYDFSDVRGQEAAIETIAGAVARHVRDPGSVAILLEGPPGTGKTMIARRVVSILPELGDFDREWLAAEYQGVFSTRPKGIDRPFRAPHHTVSQAAMTSGVLPVSHRPVAAPCRCKRAVNGDCAFHTLPAGPVARAGELLLARHGVLFLDEFPEFMLAAIEGIGEAYARMSDRTRPLLVLAANHCPCGWHGMSQRACECPEGAIVRYRERMLKLMRALRLADEQIVRARVEAVSMADLRGIARGVSSQEIRARIAGCP